FLVKPGIRTMGRVDHQLNALALDKIDDVRSSLFDFVNSLDLEAGLFDELRGSVGGDQLEAQLHESLRQATDEGLIAIVGTDKDAARGRQHLSGGSLGLGECFTEVVSH